MALRKRNSPGIEINEIDRSQYNRIQDYSLVNTTTLICGFADKGENYTAKWINTKKTFENEYGFPTNEVEKYFYNGALEILSKGGTLITSKLPYNNKSKDNFAYTELTVNLNNILTSNDFTIQKDDLLSADDSINTCFEIEYNFKHDDNDLITLDKLDEYKTTGFKDINKIRIIDITQKQYETIDLLSVYSDGSNKYNVIVNNEFLGIMPVIVSPINALYFQKIIQDEISTYQGESGSKTTSESGQQYSPKIQYYNPIANAKNRDNSELSNYANDLNNIGNNFALPLNSNLITDETVSKIATSYFPTITFNENNKLNKKYLKQIGVVVFKVVKDSITQGKLNFIPVESFVGSLDRNEIDPITKKNIFIDNIINNQSTYINFFSNINVNQYKQFDTFLIKNQTASILGYKKLECDKIIDYSNSILKPLSRIFDILQDPNYVNIDIVCDAGVSNIAQYVSKCTNEITIENYPFYFIDGSELKWTLNSFDDTKAWKTVLQKFDLFCKKQRQDCIFIADGLRPFCLDGNEKIVRKTNINNTIENSIIPKLKYMTGINSSYSAGYCDWFYVQDAYTGDLFWCPPSIKAAGIYTNVDVYFNKWDAPAGITRGKVLNVIDTAFSPKNDEAGNIYLYSWNYAVNYPLDGIVLEGQKTFQTEATALDRINVRRLLLYLKKSVNIIARRFVYEGNTEYIRQRFVDAIRPFFENAKNGYGLNDYVIRCDDILNTPEVIDRNELHCKIAIKPVKTIEWIICDFIVTNQSANVNEEVINN